MHELRKSVRNRGIWAWRLVALSLIVSATVCLCPVLAQETELTGGSTDQKANTSASQTTGGTTQSPKTLQSDADPKKDEIEKIIRRGAIVAAPIPIVSPALGSGIIPVLGYIFPLSEKDKISPPSVIGAAGLITNNGTSGFGIGTALYMKEDRYEVKAGYADGSLNYNLYGIGIAAGNAGLKLPLTQAGRVFFGEAMRNVGFKLFVGARVWIGTSRVTLRESSGETPEPPPDVGLDTKLVALGLVVKRDTSANRFYPTSGTYLKFTSDFFAQDLGSKYSFQSYRFTFNKYGSFSERQVLAYNLFICGTGGSPPFYGNCIYGANNELRGYEAGRYLDRFMVATQLEYRLTLPKRFGAVLFGGIGGVAPGADQFRSKNFLPDVGAGLRYELSKKYHVNLRVDVAQGKNSHTWSMGVGEAF